MPQEQGQVSLSEMVEQFYQAQTAAAAILNDVTTQCRIQIQNYQKAMSCAQAFKAELDQYRKIYGELPKVESAPVDPAGKEIKLPPPAEKKK